MTTSRTWVLVLSARHAQAAVAGGFIMVGTGKRPALACLAAGDRIVVYSPRTDHPGGEPLSAVTAIGTVTGEQPVGDESAGFTRAAAMIGVAPVPLDRIRQHLSLPLLRFGCIALSQSQGGALWATVTAPAAASTNSHAGTSG